MRSHTERTRGNRYRLHQERFHLDVRKKFFTVRAISDWNTTSPGTCWSPHHWRFSRSNWTGRQIISPRLPFPQKVEPDSLSKSLPAWAVLQDWSCLHTPSSLQVFASPGPRAASPPRQLPCCPGTLLPAIPHLPLTRGNHDCTVPRHHLHLTGEALPLLADPSLLLFFHRRICSLACPLPDS